MINDKLSKDIFQGKVKLKSKLVEEADPKLGQKLADSLNDATKTRTILLSLYTEACDNYSELTDAEQKKKFVATVKTYHIDGLKKIIDMLEKSFK